MKTVSSSPSLSQLANLFSCGGFPFCSVIVPRTRTWRRKGEQQASCHLGVTYVWGRAEGQTDRQTAAGFVSPLTAPLCHIRARTRTRRRRAHVPQGQERDKGLQLLSTAREIGATSATGMPAVLGLQSKITSGLLDAPIMFPFARIQSVGRAHLVCAVPPYTTLYKRCLPRPRPPS